MKLSQMYGSLAEPVGSEYAATDLSLNAVCDESGICPWSILPRWEWRRENDRIPDWIELRGSIVAVSRNGSRFLQVPDAGTEVRVFDASMLAWCSTLYQHVLQVGGPSLWKGPDSGFVVSPDGRTIASAGRGLLAFWDAFEGRRLSVNDFTKALNKSLSARGCSSLAEAYQDFLGKDDRVAGKCKDLRELYDAVSCRRLTSRLHGLSVVEMDEIALEHNYPYFPTGSQLSLSIDGRKLLLSMEERMYAVEVPSCRLLQKFEHFLCRNGEFESLGEYKRAGFVQDGRNILVYGYYSDGFGRVTLCAFETRLEVYACWMDPHRYRYGFALHPGNTALVKVRVNCDGAWRISVMRLARPHHVWARAKGSRGTMFTPEESCACGTFSTQVSPRGH